MADYIKADKVEFISMSEFKARVNEDKLEVVRNPNSGKLFLAGVESNWKVQAEYTPDKETRMLVPDGDLEQACVVNVKNTSEVLATF